MIDGHSLGFDDTIMNLSNTREDLHQRLLFRYGGGMGGGGGAGNESIKRLYEELNQLIKSKYQTQFQSQLAQTDQSLPNANQFMSQYQQFQQAQPFQFQPYSQPQFQAFLDPMQNISPPQQDLANFAQHNLQFHDINQYTPLFTSQMEQLQFNPTNQNNQNQIQNVQIQNQTSAQMQANIPEIEGEMKKKQGQLLALLQKISSEVSLLEDSRHPVLHSMVVLLVKCLNFTFLGSCRNIELDNSNFNNASAEQMTNIINIEEDQTGQAMVLASNALVHLLDLLPEAAKQDIQQKDALILLARTQNMEYPDLTANCISIVSHLSTAHYQYMLTKGEALSRLFAILDFFVTAQQKTILQIIVNIVKSSSFASSISGGGGGVGGQWSSNLDSIYGMGISGYRQQMQMQRQNSQQQQISHFEVCQKYIHPQLSALNNFLSSGSLDRVETALSILSFLVYTFKQQKQQTDNNSMILEQIISIDIMKNLLSSEATLHYTGSGNMQQLNAQRNKIKAQILRLLAQICQLSHSLTVFALENGLATFLTGLFQSLTATSSQEDSQNSTAHHNDQNQIVRNTSNSSNDSPYSNYHQHSRRRGGHHHDNLADMSDPLLVLLNTILSKAYETSPMLQFFVQPRPLVAVVEDNLNNSPSQTSPRVARQIEQVDSRYYGLWRELIISIFPLVLTLTVKRVQHQHSSAHNQNQAHNHITQKGVFIQHPSTTHLRQDTVMHFHFDVLNKMLDSQSFKQQHQVEEASSQDDSDDIRNKLIRSGETKLIQIVVTLARKGSCHATELSSVVHFLLFLDALVSHIKRGPAVSKTVIQHLQREGVLRFLDAISSDSFRMHCVVQSTSSNLHSEAQSKKQSAQTQSQKQLSQTCKGKQISPSLKGVLDTFRGLKAAKVRQSRLKQQDSSKSKAKSKSKSQQGKKKIKTEKQINSNNYEKQLSQIINEASEQEQKKDSDIRRDFESEEVSYDFVSNSNSISISDVSSINSYDDDDASEGLGHNNEEDMNEMNMIKSESHDSSLKEEYSSSAQIKLDLHADTNAQVAVVAQQQSVANNNKASSNQNILSQNKIVNIVEEEENETGKVNFKPQEQGQIFISEQNRKQSEQAQRIEQQKDLITNFAQELKRKIMSKIEESHDTLPQVESQQQQQQLQRDVFGESAAITQAKQFCKLFQKHLSLTSLPVEGGCVYTHTHQTAFSDFLQNLKKLYCSYGSLTDHEFAKCGEPFVKIIFTHVFGETNKLITQDKEIEIFRTKVEIILTCLTTTTTIQANVSHSQVAIMPQLCFDIKNQLAKEALIFHQKEVQQQQFSEQFAYGSSGGMSFGHDVRQLSNKVKIDIDFEAKRGSKNEKASAGQKKLKQKTPKKEQKNINAICDLNIRVNDNSNEMCEDCENKKQQFVKVQQRLQASLQQMLSVPVFAERCGTLEEIEDSILKFNAARHNREIGANSTYNSHQQSFKQQQQQIFGKSAFAKKSKKSKYQVNDLFDFEDDNDNDDDIQQMLMNDLIEIDDGNQNQNQSHNDAKNKKKTRGQIQRQKKTKKNAIQQIETQISAQNDSQSEENAFNEIISSKKIKNYIQLMFSLKRQKHQKNTTIKKKSHNKNSILDLEAPVQQQDQSFFDLQTSVLSLEKLQQEQEKPAQHQQQNQQSQPSQKYSSFQQFMQMQDGSGRRLMLQCTIAKNSFLQHFNSPLRVSQAKELLYSALMADYNNLMTSTFVQTRKNRPDFQSILHLLVVSLLFDHINQYLSLGIEVVKQTGQTSNMIPGNSSQRQVQESKMWNVLENASLAARLYALVDRPPIKHLPIYQDCNNQNSNQSMHYNAVEYFSLPQLIMNTLPNMMRPTARLQLLREMCLPIQRSLFHYFQQHKDVFNQQSSQSLLENTRIGRFDRKKVPVERGSLLKRSLSKQHLQICSSKKCLIEFEFQNEEGSGLGPTLEYYSLLSTQFAELRFLWRGTTSDHSLFPAMNFFHQSIADCDCHTQRLEESIISGILAKQQSEGRIKQLGNDQKDLLSSELNEKELLRCKQVQRCFFVLGAVVGRAILDERIMDLPLNPVFLSLVLNRPVLVQHMTLVDPVLAATLQEFASIHTQYLSFKSQLQQQIPLDDSNTTSEQQQLQKQFKYKGMNIIDLCLHMVLPGTDYELVPNGSSIAVSLENLGLFVEKVLECALIRSVHIQVAAFQSGFNQVMDLSIFQHNFTEKEFAKLYQGEQAFEVWDMEMLSNDVIPAYGFTHNSQQYLDFLKIMADLNVDERKQFLLFLTGTTRLPCGGLRNLKPKMTIVKKSVEEYQNPDGILPSVMTCQNYVKLPEYSSIQIMKEKLFYAIQEGQNAFALS